MFRNLEDSERMARNAIASAEKSREANNIYTAYAQGLLADALLDEGRHAEAAVTYSEALRAYERHYRSTTSPDAVELAGATQLLAWSLVKDAKFTEAAMVSSEALTLSLTLFGPDSLEVAGSMANLATARMLSGLYDDESEVLLRRAQTIYSVNDGEESKQGYAQTCFTLASYYLQTKDFDAAEREFLKAAESDSSLTEETKQEVRDWIGIMRDEMESDDENKGRGFDIADSAGSDKR